MAPSGGPEAREKEWQAACDVAGNNGVLWAVVMLLVKHGIVTVEELEREVQAQAGRVVGLRARSWSRENARME